ncbi:MAG TPA: hypothetical protein VFE30_16170 [Anaeromyxobacteraceae bacterium]|jgi:hypothetical protein|nr:hypothetical protein [Anaeromyxobacteraceae bacterium]
MEPDPAALFRHAEADDLERAQDAIALMARGAEQLRAVLGLQVADDWYAVLDAALAKSSGFKALSQKSEALALPAASTPRVGGGRRVGDCARLAAWLLTLRPEIKGTLAAFWAIAVGFEDPVSLDPNDPESVGVANRDEIEPEEPAVPGLVFKKRVEKWAEALKTAKGIL